MKSIRELQEIAGKIADEHGWWETNRNDGELIALMHSELSEALEAMRKPCASSVKDIDPVAEELADAVIRILDFCAHRGLDLENAVEKKMEFNRSRPYKHGKKF